MSTDEGNRDLFSNNCQYLLNTFIADSVSFIICITSLKTQKNARDRRRCYLCLQMRKQGLERWSDLLSGTRLVSGGPGRHTWLCSQSPTPCCLSGGSDLPGRPWVWRGVAGAVGPCLAAAYTVSWVCCEAASSALAPQKASSPVGVGFMMWFPSSCLWRLALLPWVRKPWVADNLWRWSQSCPLCVQDGSCLCHHVVSQWCCDGLSSAVWFGVRGHTLATPLLMSPLMPVMSEFNHRLLFLHWI